MIGIVLILGTVSEKVRRYLHAMGVWGGESSVSAEQNPSKKNRKSQSTTHPHDFAV